MTTAAHWVVSDRFGLRIDVSRKTDAIVLSVSSTIDHHCAADESPKQACIQLHDQGQNMPQVVVVPLAVAPVVALVRSLNGTEQDYQDLVYSVDNLLELAMMSRGYGQHILVSMEAKVAVEARVVHLGMQ